MFEQQRQQQPKTTSSSKSSSWAMPSFFRELIEPEVRTRESLPAPPAGMEWTLTSSRQWQLVKTTQPTTTTPTPTMATTSPPPSSSKTTLPPVSPAPIPAVSQRGEEQEPFDEPQQQQQQQQPTTTSLPPRRNHSIPSRTNSSSGNGSYRSRNSVTGAGSYCCDNHTVHTNHCGSSGEDWEYLSDRQLSSQSGVLVSPGSPHRGKLAHGSTGGGSVRSITTIEATNHQNSHGTALRPPLSVPNVCSGLASIPSNNSYQIQRTASNTSTIDSNADDGVLGPAGLGVLGVDYVEHVVLPTDTLQGICLAYKISSTQLKMANHFSGSNLCLAPKRLVIPISKSAFRRGYLRVQDTDAKEYKLHAFLAEFAATTTSHNNNASTTATSNVINMTMVEARGYLELADWDLAAAIASAKSDLRRHHNGHDNDHDDMDGEWDDVASLRSNNSLKSSQSSSSSSVAKGRSGEIHISGRVVRGAGLKHYPQSALLASAVQRHQQQQRQQYKPPSLLDKNVSAEDLRNAASQHAQYGVELLPVRRSMSSSRASSSS
jgi:LysM repeat protein